jgi:WD40 repeat protein
MVGSDSSNCNVLDIESGREVSSFIAQSGRMVYSLEISHDETKCITASWDSSVKVFAFPSGKELASLVGHTSVVMSVSVNKSFSRAITGSWDFTCRVWNLKTYECERVLAMHTSDCNAVAISEDGSKAVSASDDRRCYLWCLETGSLLHTFTGHTEFIVSVAFKYSDGRFRLVTGSWDGTIRSIDNYGSPIERQVIGYSSKVACARFNANGSLLCVGTFNNRAQIIDLDHSDRLRLVALLTQRRIPTDIAMIIRKMLFW